MIKYSNAVKLNECIYDNSILRQVYVKICYILYIISKIIPNIYELHVLLDQMGVYVTFMVMFCYVTYKKQEYGQI